MDPALDEWHKACFVCGMKKCKRAILSNIRFHTFPQNPEKCQMWVSKIGIPKLKNLTLKQLRSRVICSNHFSNEMYINDKRLRLSATAYPDIIDFKPQMESETRSNAENSEHFQTNDFVTNKQSSNDYQLHSL